MGIAEAIRPRVVQAPPGVAVGALVVLGPSAWLPTSIAVASASIATNLLIGRNTWLVFIFAFVNVAQALLTAWLIERWFGRAIKLEDLRQILGFLVASAVGAAIVAVGAAGAVALVGTTESSRSEWMRRVHPVDLKRKLAAESKIVSRATW